MSYGYKAKTNASQVAIRDWYSTNAAVLMRVANGSTIEVGTRLYYDSDGTAWRQCAYGLQKLGYMMNEFITITDQTKNKYRMIDTMEAFGNAIYQRGHSDLHADYGDIHNIQLALNKIAREYFSTIEGRPLLTVTVDGIFGSGTEKAVANAQAWLGCDIDGKVGPHTKARLGFVAYGYGGWPLAENAD